MYRSGDYQDGQSGNVAGCIEVTQALPPMPDGFLSADTFFESLEKDPQAAAQLADGSRKLAELLCEAGRPVTMQQLRLRQGLSQAQLAARVNTTQNRISLIENNRTDAHFSLMVAIASALEVTLDELSRSLPKGHEADS